MFELSAILCTHNPRPDIIARTLAALEQQSLGVDRWELLVVDSCSSPALDERLDLSWHPHARIIKEQELGANAARLSAFRVCDGEILVIVDDDNHLNPDYLEQALNIAQRWPQLGAWGGSIVGEFEETPPDWLHGISNYLAIREVTTEIWTNVPSDFRHLPFGAGMCLRRSVAERYQKEVAGNFVKRCLGRCGEYPVSGEDPDIACTAFDDGLGIGLFPELKMRHFIPSSRLKQGQALETMQGNHAGVTLLQHLRGQLNPSRSSVIPWLRALFHYYRMAPFERRMSRACARGQAAVILAVREVELGKVKTPDDFRAAYLSHARRTFSNFP